MSVKDDLTELLEKDLFPLPSTALLFNQYLDEDPQFDLPGAARIRRENLARYISNFTKRPEWLLIGEAPGPWGCRFSGIPFTSEKQLISGALPFKGERSGIRKAPHSEASGTVLWGALAEFYPRFLIWNAVPLHPHKPGVPLSIRTPSPAEIKQFSVLLKKVIALTGPKEIIAVGRSAERALVSTGAKCSYIRHPSQAGAAEFRREIKKLLKNEA
ncbi:MAG: uracil-DNA glycosylase [Actinomycetota bacterium]|nr:uracil-DNA glycosylase [Actinomycetota bacterium]